MVQIKKKVKILEKQSAEPEDVAEVTSPSITSSTVATGIAERPQTTKKSKWWLWTLLAGIVIVGVILIVKSYFSNSSDKSFIAKTEQATAKANEIIANLQSDNVNIEDAEIKVAEAQKAVDDAKANVKTAEGKQAIDVAQTKVAAATKAVEVAKQATKPIETQETVTTEQEVASTTPAQSTNEKSATNASKSDQSPADKSSNKQSSPSSASLPEETLEQKAKEVIRGIYGNGADRKRALGTEYSTIQSKVNEMYRNGEVR